MKLSKYKSEFIFLLISIGAAIDLVNVTAAITSTLNLQTHYNITSSKASWVLTSYAITFSSFIALLGRIGDAIGNFTMFLYCSCAFSIVSLICALPSVPFECFLVFRALQGLFAAGMIPASYAITNYLYNNSHKASMVAFSILSSIFSVSFGIGFLIGGAFDESEIGFKGIYYISFGIVLLTSIVFFIVAKSYKISNDKYKSQISIKNLDFLGCFMFVTGNALLVTGLTEGGENWNKASSISCFTLGISLLVFFFIWNFFGLYKYLRCFKSVQLLIPRDILSASNFIVLLIAEFLNYSSLFSHLLLICYYLQYVEGYSSLWASVRLLPSVGAMLIGTVTLAFFPNIFPPRSGCLIGFMFIFAGSLVLKLTISREDLFWNCFFPTQILISLGSSIFFPISLNLLIGLSPIEYKALVSGIAQTFAQFGVSVAFSVLASLLGNLSEYTGEINQEMVDRFGRSVNFVLASGSLGFGLILFMCFYPGKQSEQAEGLTESKV